MNLIGKQAHITYLVGNLQAEKVFGTITGMPYLGGEATTFIEVTDGDDIRYIPIKNLVHIHIGELE